MLSKERLAEIRARCEKATLGPWGVCYDSKHSDYSICELAHWPKANGLARSDAEFIRHAREDLPWLLAIAEAALEWKEAKESLATAPRARAGQENHEEFESAIGSYMAAEEALLDMLEDD